MDFIGRGWTDGNKKPAISNGFFIILHLIGFIFGGGAGNRIDIVTMCNNLSYSLTVFDVPP
jgi:hypothetical protein